MGEYKSRIKAIQEQYSPIVDEGQAQVRNLLTQQGASGSMLLPPFLAPKRMCHSPLLACLSLPRMGTPLGELPLARGQRFPHSHATAQQGAVLQPWAHPCHALCLFCPSHAHTTSIKPRHEAAAQGQPSCQCCAFSTHLHTTPPAFQVPGKCRAGEP